MKSAISSQTSLLELAGLFDTLNAVSASVGVGPAGAPKSAGSGGGGIGGGVGGGILGYFGMGASSSGSSSSLVGSSSSGSLRRAVSSPVVAGNFERCERKIILKGKKGN